MEESEKRELIENYFLGKPAMWPFVGVLVGIAIAYFWIWWVGLIIVAVLLYFIIAFFRIKKPSDQQMDQWLEEDIEYFRNRALENLRIEKRDLIREGVELIGPRVWYKEAMELRSKMGKDGRLRYSPIDLLLLNFTEKQLLVYRTLFDFVGNTVGSEITEEYFYRDVISVSKGPGTVNVPNGNGEVVSVNGEIFKLTTSGGTSIEFVLNSSKMAEIFGGYDGTAMEKAEKAIQVIRQVLREKK